MSSAVKTAFTVGSRLTLSATDDSTASLLIPLRPSHLATRRVRKDADWLERAGTTRTDPCVRRKLILINDTNELSYDVTVNQKGAIRERCVNVALTHTMDDKEWVQCDRCKKWRGLKREDFKAIVENETWYLCCDQPVNSKCPLGTVLRIRIRSIPLVRLHRK